jgi:hypothetical protein
MDWLIVPATWLLLLSLPAALVWFIVRVFKPAPGPSMACLTCEHVGPTATRARGSLGMEVALWLLLIVPGMIYSVWRVTGKRPVCQQCGSDALVPSQSPAGRRLLTQAQARG